jgi:hypothetical protein
MQIITLEQAKVQLNVSFSARDTAITQLANGLEAEILSHIGVPTKAAALALTPEPMQDLLESVLESAVLLCLTPRDQDNTFNIWDPKFPLSRMLQPFRVPSISPGTD